jgi:hypothetical protein
MYDIAFFRQKLSPAQYPDILKTLLAQSTLINKTGLVPTL